MSVTFCINSEVYELLRQEAAKVKHLLLKKLVKCSGFFFALLHRWCKRAFYYSPLDSVARLKQLLTF